MKKPFYKITAISVGLFLFGAGLVIAQQNYKNADVITAAYHKKTKVLRIVEDEKLRPNEIPLSWNIKGPQGDVGPMGHQGDPGEDADMDSVEALVEQMINERFSSLLNLQSTIDDLQSRVAVLEDKVLDLQPADFVFVHYYEDLLLSDDAHKFDAVQDDAGVVSLEKDGDGLNIVAVGEGEASVFVSNAIVNILEQDKQQAFIDVSVDTEGVVSIDKIVPWRSGAWGGFTAMGSSYCFFDAEICFSNIESISVDKPGVVDIREPILSAAYHVIAESDGEVVITIVGTQGEEATIEVVVEDGVITRFKVNQYEPQPKSPCDPNPCTDSEPYCDGNTAVSFFSPGRCSIVDTSYSCSYKIESTIDCSSMGLTCQLGECL